jgi:hypothetical protein
MKNYIPLILLLGILSCKGTPTETKPATPQPKKEIVEEPTVEEDEIEVVEKEVDLTLVSLVRKPCSGDCPVFDVTITKDSILTYHGKKYTNIEGYHTLKLTAEQFDDITQLLEDANFSELNARYTKSGTSDFAESIIRYEGKDVTVRLWKDAPKRLTAIYVFIEDLLYDQKFLAE